MMSDPVVRVMARFSHATTGAYLLYIRRAEFGHEVKCWVPKSLVSYKGAFRRGCITQVHIPMWFALQERLEYEKVED